MIVLPIGSNAKGSLPRLLFHALLRLKAPSAGKIHPSKVIIIKMAERLMYQTRSSPAADPNEARLDSFITICQRSIQGDQAFFLQGEFRGQTVYFCTEACQQVFLSDPEGFIAAHSKRRA